MTRDGCRRDERGYGEEQNEGERGKGEGQANLDGGEGIEEEREEGFT